MKIAMLIGVLAMVGSLCLAAEGPSRPSVGAIRWDAWTGGTVTTQVERSLGPQKYHHRLPWFAQVVDTDRVRIDGSPQAVMDQEIAFAADAGLDYWAFVLYREDVALSHSLKSYLKSPARNKINFCVILHNSFGVPEALWPKERDRAVALLKEPGYQTVLNGRPLVYAFQVTFKDKFPDERMADFLRAAQAAGVNPYCVYMGWNPASDFRDFSAMGFEAVSAYAYNSNAAAFAGLCQEVETQCWQNAAKAGVPYIPLVTTGWDYRPRIDNPVSWQKELASHGEKVFPAAATPQEIASHLDRAVRFVQENKKVCPAHAIIIYAWNEHDEGGWLAPTWTPGGKPNTERLEAIGRILKRDSPAARPPVVPASAPVPITVRPPESDEILRNPGKGWVIYGPWKPKTPEVWAMASVGYQRYKWSQLQPSADAFNWSEVDQDIAECKAHGLRFAFGVMPANSGSTTGQATPPWVFDKGAASYTGTDGRKYPVWDDPVYIKEMAAFVKALAARYDGSDDIAYIDARSFGNWGEWNLCFIGGADISNARKSELLDAWAVFAKTDIVVPNNLNTPQYQAQYGTDARGFGIRRDSSEVDPDGAAYCYDKALAVSEWSTSYSALKQGSGWAKQVWKDACISEYMSRSRYSYDNLGQWGADSALFYSEKESLVRTWANRMGYWFKVTRAVFPSHLGNGQSGEIILDVRNDGVAPIYVNKKNSVLKLALVDASGHMVGSPVVLDGVRPFDWKPGQTISSKAAFGFPRTANASRLALGVFSKPSLANPDVKFGNLGRTENGWLVLGP